ncbi:putative zinc finger CCCH domain-containing protein 38 [Forsythia ovata]|uniref:Zinc finger CCCH domain-containing protein 38 n=1 Tax=Forsythia ovata TaxID=205694 RepID=A0ABD1U8L4_9LAMI
MSPGLNQWREENMSPGLNQWREERRCFSDRNGSTSYFSVSKGGKTSQMLPSSSLAGGKNGGVLDESNKAKDIGTQKIAEKTFGSKKGDAGNDIRTFKFALADFVKDLLKPKWKEGQLSKAVHKIVAKKVVNKIIRSVEATHVPQTKENIDNYLLLARPKVSKLVQLESVMLVDRLEENLVWQKFKKDKPSTIEKHDSIESHDIIHDQMENDDMDMDIQVHPKEVMRFSGIKVIRKAKRLHCLQYLKK